MVIEWEMDEQKEHCKQLLSQHICKNDTNLNRQHLM